MQSMNDRYPLVRIARTAGGSRPPARLSLAFAVFLAATLPLTPAFAQTAAGARALVLAVQGDVRIHETEAKAARALKADSTIPVGVEIRTGKKSAVTLQLSPTLICRIGENTVVQLENLKGVARLKLAVGSVGAQVQPNTKTRMEVVTTTAIAGVRGTEFIVETDRPSPEEDSKAMRPGDTRVLVNEGVVAVSPPDDESASRDVQAGNKILSDGESLKLSILENFERQKFSIFEGFAGLKKKNYEAYVDQLRRNEELKEQMQRMKEMR
ncbi:MAG: FecR family protein [Leptospirales bacterium]|jgi:hypothetical protein